MVGSWRRLQNEELHNLHTSPNIIRVIKSKRVTWNWHVPHLGEVRNAHKILIGKSEGKRQLEDPGVGGNIIVELILGMGRCGLDSSGSGLGPVAVCGEHGNKPPCSVTGGTSIDWQSDC